MKQLSSSKSKKLVSSLKKYRRKFLHKKYKELDESATRLMINSFLSDVLGWKTIDEIKTEYMIRGAYADYVVQLKGRRYFIVEVKALPIQLAEKHLRQVINYAANEGIDWALLTNGQRFQLHRVIFDKPISSRLVFDVDVLSDKKLREAAAQFQYLTKILAMRRGLDHLWNRSSALDLSNISRFLYDKPVVNYLRKQLRRKFKIKVDETDIFTAVKKVIEEAIESGKPFRSRRRQKARRNISKTVSPLEPTSIQPSTVT